MRVLLHSSRYDFSKTSPFVKGWEFDSLKVQITEIPRKII